MPFCQYVCSPLRSRRFALAPVAMMTVSAASGSPSSWYFRQHLKGRRKRSIFDTISVIIVLPNRSDRARNLSINSGPNTPPGNPGKFERSTYYNATQRSAVAQRPQREAASSLTCGSSVAPEDAGSGARSLCEGSSTRVDEAVLNSRIDAAPPSCRTSISKRHGQFGRIARKKQQHKSTW